MSESSKYKKIILIAVVSVFMQGCGTLTGGNDQKITITSENDNYPEETFCVLKNDKQEMDIFPKKTYVIKRSKLPLEIECANSEQVGSKSVRPKVRGFIRFLDIITDFCTISCAIDRATGASYTYPRDVEVFMKNKRVNER